MIGIIVFVLGIPSVIYGLTLNGGASLGGVLILSGVILFIPFFIIDRILVKWIKPLKLSILELIFSLIILLCYNIQQISI
ncbi:hypothetical protein SAMN04487910_3179 [Aquimarina amphilecti]|uniref:Uncharacterized protein n=2 Tax=Aquimarina amphilecti TaxID=1038014 RepID=A0A1H7SKZ0_AQUAM|nr:hypothetical protein SAMN04487910_3179 [Aquimarina amphilecti]